MEKWSHYHQRAGNKPNSLVVQTLKDFVKERNAALDLGAGNLRDSRFLLKEGFKKVVAVDRSEESLTFQTEGIDLIISPIQSYLPPKDEFDFVFSCNTLFFFNNSQILEIIRNVKEGLRQGGIFACNVLGPEDDWVFYKTMPVSCFTEKELENLFAGFEVLGTAEIKKDLSYLNEHGFMINKFWHQVSIVVCKL